MKISFQTIILVIFGFFILFGVAVFAGYINIGSSSKNSTQTGTLVMWGTVKKSAMESFLNLSGVSNEDLKIVYVEKNADSYETDLVNAFASGVGPDLFMTTPEIFWKQRDKMYEIPYSSYTLASYKTNYMDVANNYLTTTGIMAFPLFTDPLVAFWNKDIFASAGLSTAPLEWKEFPELSNKISIVADDFTITRSFTALGEYTNIRNAKDILSLLFMQAGEPITIVGADKKLSFTLGLSNNANNIYPSAVALDYYAQFANPSNVNVYSWNKSFRSDYDRFLSGDLAYYFGFASEVASIRQTNPNLNFEMTFVPQTDKNGRKTTIGRLYGVAISKQTKNLGLSYFALVSMLGPQTNQLLITKMRDIGTIVAPVRRDLAPNDPANQYAGILYQSALVSRNWIDPNPSFTNSVWGAMVSDVQSGKSAAINSIITARTKMQSYLQTQN